MENKIDLTHLLLLVGGDEAMAQRFLDLFRTEIPKQMTALEGQLKTGDLTAANVTAHAIKGQLRVLGLEGLANVAAAIEDKTEMETAHHLVDDFIQLKNGIAALIEQ